MPLRCKLVFPYLTVKVLSNLFNFFKIKIKIKEVHVSSVKLHHLFLGTVLVFPKHMVEIMEQTCINLASSRVIVRDDKFIFLDNSTNIVYRWAINKLGSISIVKNYNFMASSEFDFIPKPIFLQDDGELTISAETLMVGLEVALNDVDSEMADELFRQISCFYEYGLSKQPFDFSNELSCYDEIIKNYNALWKIKLREINILISEINEEAFDCKKNIYKTYIHGDLTYRNIVRNEDKFLIYDFERSEYSFIEFDIYLFYIDRATHSEKATYEIFFRNIFKFIRNDFDINHHRNYYANIGVDSYLKYIFLYRMLVFSLQHKHFKNSEQQTIGLLNYIISELKEEL